MDIQLARRHLDARFAKIQAVELFLRPGGGWVRAIREALGLTLSQLADRLGNSKQWVLRLERQEVKNSVTLATLEKAAQALDCCFVYAIVPKDSLQAMIEAQATLKADKLMQHLQQTMQLENQSVSSEEVKAQRDWLIMELLADKPSRLWNVL